MPVEAWLGEFLKRHRVRYAPHDWPDVPDEMLIFKQNWLAAFALARVTEDEAEEASIGLGSSPPKYRRDHIPAIVQAIRTNRDLASGLVEGPPPDSREAATAASRRCDDCGGQTGLTVRFRRESAKPGVNPAVVFYCRCPMGRWLERTRREGNETSRDIHRRIYDLAAHRWAWGHEYRERHFDPDTSRSSRGLKWSRGELAAIGAMDREEQPAF